MEWHKVVHLMHRLRFASPRKDNKCILLITRREKFHPNLKRNGILKICYMVLDHWPKAVSEGTNACADSIPSSELEELELKGWKHKTRL